MTSHREFTGSPCAQERVARENRRRSPMSPQASLDNNFECRDIETKERKPELRNFGRTALHCAVVNLGVTLALSSP
jgi:hypothetical protein